MDTKELGVAKTNTSSGAIILVYRYAPSGNYAEEFAENVKPSVVKPPPGDGITYTASLLVCLVHAISSMIQGLTIF